MNKIRIVARLESKINEWLETAPDLKQYRNDIIISGGAITSLISGEEPHDYDIYFASKESALAVAKYYAVGLPVDEYSFENIDGVVEDRFRIKIQSSGYSATKELILTDNAVTLPKPKIQLIFRFYGSPDELHKNFDFAHCTAWYSCKDKKLVLPQEMMEAAITKSLIYTGGLYPVASLFRIRKFLARGYTISAGELIKIAYRISCIDLTDRAVMQDQLIGVDQSYLSDMMDKLSAGEGPIDATYLAQLIDEIFNGN